jgi:WD40 repeat protein/nitroreductase
MSWPLSQEYNEAIQSPVTSFADAELRGGEAVTNDLGLPMPRSGNFADVYEFRCPNGSRWAVKCFTREVPGLRERYQEISRHLQQAKLPFTVEFTYLEEGIRIHGDWYPVLKMQWVEGFTFNDFIRQQLDKPAMMGALLQIWARMATRLREAGIAHADLQHGNVLLVPGSSSNSVAVKLIDYDGMYVPGLDGKKSGEVGHPSYQHPQRLREGTYSREVDRFPLLLVATALRCLKTGGRTLWEKYDNGDNLLFREADLRAPQESALFQELEKWPDAGGRTLVGQLRQALAGRLETTPLLDDLLPKLLPETVTASPPVQTSVATTSRPKTAVSTKAPAAAKQTTVAPAAESEGVRWDKLTDDAENGKVVAKKAPKGKSQGAQLATKKWLIAGAAAGVALPLFIAVLGLAGLWAAGVFKGKTKDATIVLENLPPDADVFVDGEKVAVKAADGKTFEVHVDASRKKHRVEVKKEGFHVYGEEVEVEAGGRTSVVARLAAIVPLDGTLVLENLPPGAQVTVDGNPVTVATAEGKPAEIHVAPEKRHHVEVKQDGFKKQSEDVRIDPGNRRVVVIRLEPDLRTSWDPQTSWESWTGKNWFRKQANGAWVEGAGEKGTYTFTERTQNADYIELYDVQRRIGMRLFADHCDMKMEARGPDWTLYQAGGWRESYLPLFAKSLTGTKEEGKGSWKTDTAGVLIGQGPFAAIVTQTATYQDFVAVAEVSASADVEAFVGVRIQGGMGGNPWQGLSSRIYGDGNVVRAGQIDGILGQSDRGQLQEIKPGETFTIAAKVTGNQLTIAVNGLTTGSYSVSPIPATGRIGLLITKGSLRVTRSVVKELPATKVPEQGFVTLFNGKDLNGWKTHPDQPGNWRVENGILVGSGSPSSYLYSERDDYKDFHLRVEARINDSGDSGVFFRAAFGAAPEIPRGYEAQIANRNRELNKTGSLYAGDATPVVSIREILVPSADWFTQEVIVEGNHILIKINGKTTADFTDEKRRFTSGHIALQQFLPQTVAEFRKVEIKELNATKPPEPMPEIVKNNPNGSHTFANRSGAWKIDGTELAQDTLLGDSRLVFGDFTWKDYDFSCEAKKVGNVNEFGLLYHVGSSAYGHYALGTNKNQRIYSLFYTQNRISPDKHQDSSLDADRWYKLRIRLRGTHCEFYLDDKLLFECDEPKSTHGAVGLMTSGLSPTRFRNIRVTDPDGKVLFEGLPELPPNTDQWLPAVEKSSEEEQFVLKGHGHHVTGVAFFRDGHRVLSCNNTEPSTFRLWDADTGKELFCSTRENGTVPPSYSKLALSADGTLYLTYSSSIHRVLLGEIAGDKLQAPVAFLDNVPNVLDLGFTADGRKARALTNSGEIYEWNVADKKLTNHIQSDLKNVACGALSPNGRFALLAKNNQPLTEIDLDSGKVTERWKEPIPYPFSLAISPDGSRVLVGNATGGLDLWDAAATKSLGTLTGYTGSMKSVAFSPDGRTALSGCGDWAVRLWDVESKKELASFRGHTGIVTHLAFSPDGSRAVSGSTDYTVRVWRLRDKPPAVVDVPPPPGEPDPIRETLDKAKADFEAVLTKQRKNIVDALDRTEDSARKAGKKDVVDQVKADRDAFEKDNLPPQSVPAAAKDYQQKMSAAQTALDLAFRGAIAAYTKKKLDDKAEAVEKEKKSYQLAHPADALQPGTVWKGKMERKEQMVRSSMSVNLDITLTVLERDGKSFKVKVEVGGSSIEARGSIDYNGKLNWLAKDVKVVRGNDAYDYTGQISGKVLGLQFQATQPNKTITGIASLQLVDKK